ncbi:MAG: cytochrome c biogenesis protein CcsA, partial [Giesbergeria sp.]
AGFVLLTATLGAGMLFSEALYGRAWHWDHKAVFSLLSWLTFAALLVGRKRFGWRGRSAVRVLYAGALLLLLAYVGSRFALEVVLGRSA